MSISVKRDGGRLEVNALTEEVGSCIGFPAFELLRSHVFKSPRKHPFFRDALCPCCLLFLGGAFG